MRRSRPHHRRSRRRSLRRQQLQFLAGLGLTVMGLLAAALTGDYVERERQRALLAEAGSSQTEGLHPDGTALVSPPDPGQRPVFPYSIVDGGVLSAEELKEAMERDPVVAKHFASFDLSKTRVERLQQPKTAHVSYRIGDEVFWTRKTVVIPAGETVLTDGTNFCRTRCANQLASTPGPVSPLEPPVSLLDTPLPARPRIVPPGGLPAVSGPGALAGSGSRSSSAGPAGGGVGGVGGVPLASGRPLSGGGAVPASLGLSPGHPDNAPHNPTVDGNPADPPSTPVRNPTPGVPPGTHENPPGPSPPGNPGSPHGNPDPPAGNPGPPAGNPGPPVEVPWTPPPRPWMPPGDPFTPLGNPWTPPGNPGDPPGDPGLPPNYPGGPGNPYDPGGPGHPPAGPNEPRSIPEPATTLLMLAGGAFAAWRRWKTPERQARPSGRACW